MTEIQVYNLEAWIKYFQKLHDTLAQDDLYSKQLAESMRKFVHVRTGKLRRSIYFRGDRVGATAPYAYVEVLRGGTHNFVDRAIQVLDIEKTVQGVINAIQ